jgi:serine protease Do
MEVVDQLKHSGKVNRGWLGIQIQALTPELGKSFGLTKPHGALVGQILPDGPARSSGIKVGDIIIAFNGQAVQHSSDLPMMVGRTRPGTSVLLTVIRDGKERHLTVQIAQLPDESKLQNVMTGSHTNNRLGLVIAELPLEKRKQGNTGVLVKDVDEGPAAKAGIRPGDVIISINNIDVSDVNKFSDLIEQLPINKPIPVLLLREDGALFLALTIPK